MMKRKQILFGNKAYSCTYDPNGADDPDEENPVMNQARVDDWYAKQIAKKDFIPKDHTVEDVDVSDDDLDDEALAKMGPQFKKLVLRALKEINQSDSSIFSAKTKTGLQALLSQLRSS